MNVKKIANGAVKTVKQNPELALLLLGIVAPKLGRKITPIVAAVVASKDKIEPYGAGPGREYP